MWAHHHFNTQQPLTYIFELQFVWYLSELKNYPLKDSFSTDFYQDYIGFLQYLT